MKPLPHFLPYIEQEGWGVASELLGTGSILRCTITSSSTEDKKRPGGRDDGSIDSSYSTIKGTSAAREEGSSFGRQRRRAGKRRLHSYVIGLPVIPPTNQNLEDEGQL